MARSASCARRVAEMVALLQSYRGIPKACGVAILTLALHGAAWGGGPSNVQTIASISEQATGLVFVYAQDGNWGNPDACTNSDRFILDREAPARKEMLALVLSAHLQGRTIRAYFSGCAPIGNSGLTFPTAVTITLY